MHEDCSESFFHAQSWVIVVNFKAIVLTHIKLRYLYMWAWQPLPLFRIRGGHYGPPTMNPSAVSTGSGLSSPKLMTLFLSRIERSQRSHFLNFFWKFFENWTSKIFGGPRACREKSKKLKKIPFFAKNLIFSGWICFVYILSFLLRYITLL